MHVCRSSLYVDSHLSCYLEDVCFGREHGTRKYLSFISLVGRSSDIHFSPAVNPFGKTHGAPSDSERHVGDLGNFKTDGQGNGKGSISDSQVKLIGEQSVLGVCSFILSSCSNHSFIHLFITSAALRMMKELESN